MKCIDREFPSHRLVNRRHELSIPIMGGVVDILGPLCGKMRRYCVTRKTVVLDTEAIKSGPVIEKVRELIGS